MKALLFRERKTILRSLGQRKFLILYCYIGFPLGVVFLRGFSFKDWNSGINALVLLIFLWVGSSSGNFKRTKKQDLIETFLALPKSLNEIILSKFLASLPIAIFFLLVDLGIYQSVSYYYRGDFATNVSPIVILCGLVLMLSCVLISLSAWIDNTTIKAISAIMGLMIFIVTFGFIFVEISTNKIFLVLLLYLLAGSLNWIFARNKEKIG